jgi:hypothetical protein
MRKRTIKMDRGFVWFVLVPCCVWSGPCPDIERECTPFPLMVITTQFIIVALSMMMTSRYIWGGTIIFILVPPHKVPTCTYLAPSGGGARPQRWVNDSWSREENHHLDRPHLFPTSGLFIARLWSCFVFWVNLKSVNLVHIKIIVVIFIQFTNKHIYVAKFMSTYLHLLSTCAVSFFLFSLQICFFAAKQIDFALLSDCSPLLVTDSGSDIPLFWNSLYWTTSGHNALLMIKRSCSRDTKFDDKQEATMISHGMPLCARDRCR